MAHASSKRTRLVCISDTHNCTVKLPPGDVLIHAGDLTNQGSYSELSRAVKWLEDTPFEAKVVIAGNHDTALDPDYSSRKHQHPDGPSSAECVQLLTSSPSLTYLNHESTTIHLHSATGPHTRFNVFGSPFSPRYGDWAFQYAEQPPDGDTLTTLWEDIPPDTHIVVTHTPPRGHCDATDQQRPRGCEALRRALWRVKPVLAVCGHIHDGRGAHRVQWAAGREGVTVWEDPGAANKKMSLLDLTGRKGIKTQRGETCVVNCAVMKSRYPHVGGKMFNKPIVVDVELPVWTVE